MNDKKTTAALGIEELLSHSAWVRGLAGALVRDPHLAEDLAQDTYVAALSGARPARSPKAWLGAVLRNRVREVHRTEMRRRDWERGSDVAAPGRVEPPAGDVVARAQVHATVVSAVLALRDSYREVVLMRFFDELPPRAIAERLGVPVSTVHTRLTRGLARLRLELDRRHGADGTTWQQALFGLVGPPVGAGSGSVIGGWLFVGAGLGALFLGGVVALLVHDEPPPAEPIGRRVVASEETAEPTHTPGVDEATDDAAGAAVAGPIAAPAPNPAAPRSDAPPESVVRAGLPGAPVTDASGMVRIPAGTATVGTTEEEVQGLRLENPAEIKLFAASTPKHEVAVDAFWLDRCEVTHGEWELYLRATGTAPSDELIDGAWHGASYPDELEDRPVSFVAYPEAEAFARWAGKRLPTEVEWEWAARGEDGRVYPWGDTFTDESARTAGGPFGNHDLAGSVWEWTSSPFSPYPGYADLHIVTRATGGTRERYSAAEYFNSSRRVIKGGAFDSPSLALRSDVRQFAERASWFRTIGFRCAKSEEPGTDALRFALEDVGAYLFHPTTAPLGGPVSIAVTDHDGRRRVLGHREVAFASTAVWSKVTTLEEARVEASRGPLSLGLLWLGVSGLRPELASAAYSVAWSRPRDGDRLVLRDATGSDVASWPFAVELRNASAAESPTVIERRADGDRERLRFRGEVRLANGAAIPYGFEVLVDAEALRER